MTALSAVQVLALWERGQGRTPSARALDALRSVTGEGTEGTEADPGRLPVCRRDAAVLRLLAETFAPVLDAVTSCPTCGELLELTVPADLPVSLAAVEGRLDVRADGSVEVRGGGQVEVRGGGQVEVRAEGFVVRCHAPTAGDLAAIPADMQAEAAAGWLFGRCVDVASRDGRDVLATDLPEAVRSAVEAALESCDDGAETALAMSCEVCGSAWREVLDPTPFLCAEVDRAAVRLAGAVHRLATAYGWSERDILGLSPQRRRLYLEVAAS